MDTSVVSSKFQVVIPKDIRDALGIKAGDRLQAIRFQGRVELVPIMSNQEARGFLRGIDAEVPRDKDRV